MQEEWPRLKPLAIWTALAFVTLVALLAASYRTGDMRFLWGAVALALGFSTLATVMGWRFAYRSPNAAARARHFAETREHRCPACGCENEMDASRCTGCGVSLALAHP